MTDRIISGWDITAANYDHRPRMGQAALYLTGSPDIKATSEMILENPYCVLIDQSPEITEVDVTADAFDVENGAMTVAEIGDAIHDALSAKVQGRRHSQRTPIVYASESVIPDVTKALDKAYLQGLCGLWVAHWGVDVNLAIDRILSAKGPYPVHAFQHAIGQYYDADVFSLEWLATSGQYNRSWTCHRQHWTMDELASKLAIPVTALNPGNSLAMAVRSAYRAGHKLMMIPSGAHFTYRKYPVL